jgi:hypothetical protein
MRFIRNVEKFTRITMGSDRKYDSGQQNSSTITVVTLQTPKLFASNTFMSKFRNSRREISQF